MPEFDYSKAIAELERIALKAEDSSTGVGEMDELLKRTGELAAQCRGYLRSARESLETIEREYEEDL